MNWKIFFDFLLFCVGVVGVVAICILVGSFVYIKTGNDLLAILASIFWVILVVATFLGLVVD